MRIAVISYIGQEEDCIACWAQHARTYADHIYAFCTYQDATHAMLSELQARGMPITIEFRPSETLDQAIILTEALHHLKNEYDWIFPLDADEFMIGNPRTTLPNIPIDRPLMLPWRTYVPVLTDDVQEPCLLKRVEHRRVEEVHPFCKVMIPTTMIEPHHALTLGNHTLIDTRTQAVIRPSTAISLALAHFPVRSAEQIKRKVESGWKKLQRRPDADRTAGYHWKDIVDAANITEANLEMLARRYAFHPNDPTPELTLDPVGPILCTHQTAAQTLGR
jgi:hypothetical protein